MSTRSVVIFVLLGILIIAGFGYKTYDPTPITQGECVVTDTASRYQPKHGGTKHFIQTENCGEIKTTKHVHQNIEKGKAYDFTSTGMFKWNKVASEVTPTR